MKSPERRLKLFIYARIVVTFLFLASTLILNFNESEPSYDQSFMGLVRLMAFSFLFSVVSHYLLRFTKIRLFLTYLQTIWDLLFVTVLILFTGGVSSPYAFLYLLSIMNAGVLLGRRDALYTASLCSILYGAIIDFQYFNLLAPIGLSSDPARDLGAMHIFYNVFLHLMGFVVTAVITGYLAERAQESEDALREKNINYNELEQLNTTIVSNLESGLLTVTTERRIRVFNRYAELLTGVSQAEAYDAVITDIFPSIIDINACMEPAGGEFEFKTRDGLGLTLGFNVAPFTDLNGARAGTILNFRDITAMRRMEEALKRADRMAALGELSARMAHEIRNPLAALCGSVQLLAERGAVAEADRRLLNIVVREADRLNKLITEFLAYARPTVPHREKIELRPLVEETLLFLSSDTLFDSVVLENHVPAHMIVRADIHQMKQVLLNLLRNSAEAMPEGGRIEIEAHFLLSGADGFGKAPAAVISVTDTGTGIDQVFAQNLFEPFWTTKADGTGLGLAIIYRIIESHGGSISATSPEGGGCRFTITLPV